MRSFLILIAGALLVGLLSIVCFSNKLEPITQDLITRTSKKLKENKLYDIDVDIVGKSYETKLITKLSGSVVSKKEKDKALNIAKSVEGVFGVEDNITIIEPMIISKKLVFEPVEDDNLSIKPKEPQKTVKTDNQSIKLIQDDSFLSGLSDDSTKTKTKVVDDCQERLDELLSKAKISFQSSKAEIKKDSYPLLEDISKVLKECKTHLKKVIIAGYTDSSGSEKSNLILSQKRAEAVKEYLTKKSNISPKLLKAVGYGAANPIADNKSEEGKSKNRRIEFKIEGVK